jgi:hypothetical protein
MRQAVALQPARTTVCNNARGLIRQIFWWQNNLHFKRHITTRMIAILFPNGFPSSFSHSKPPEFLTYPNNKI